MQDFKARLAALIGYGGNADFAEAAGIHPVNLSRQIRKGAVDHMIIGHLEWLEETPPARWPARWSKLRDRAKAHAKKAAA